MLCETLHRNKCTQVLDRTWRFCPQCGSRCLAISWKDSVVDVTDSSFVLELELGTSFEADTIYLDSSSISTERTISPRQSAGEVLQVRGHFTANTSHGTIEARLHDVLRQPSDLAFQPGNSAVRRETISRTITVRYCEKPNLVIQAVPELLNARKVREQLKLRSIVGNLPPVRLKSQPIGWKVSPLEQTDTEATFEVRRQDDAQEETLHFYCENLVIPVRLIPVDQARATRTFHYVVGIDFGTSSTSVWFKDYGSDSRPTQLGKERFPTHFFLKRPLNLETWKYGQEAENVPLGESGLRVTELKRLLWEQAIILPGADPKDHYPSPEELLAWYFKRLKNDLIQRHLEQLSGISITEIRILWQLGMPVFEPDNSDTAAKYRDTLHRIASATLCEERDEVRIIEEPYAALQAVFDTQFERKHLLREGDSVLLIDSGAGTTDVVMGRLKRDATGWILEERSFFGLSLAEARKNGLVSSSHCGGRDVTSLAGTFAIADHAKFPANYENSESEEIRRFVDTLSKNGTYMQWLLEPEPTSAFPPEIDDNRYWPSRQPGWFQRAENAKLAIFNTGDNSGGPIFSEPFKRELKRSHFELAKQWIAKAIGESLRGHLTAPPPKWCFMVGGNLLATELREAIQRAIGAEYSVELPDLIRLAVVQGLATPPRKQTELPICTVLLDDEEGQVIFKTESKTFFERNSRTQEAYILEPDKNHEVVVRLEHNGKSYVIARENLPGGLTQIRFESKLERSRLIVQYRGDGVLRTAIDLLL